ncbi:MAG: flagellar basal body P-ring protein FlgI, partial [Halomonas sp.]
MQLNGFRLIKVRLAQLGALLLMCLLALPVYAERVIELASFAGVRDNQLVGYGLVVGLDSTGDQTTQAPFTSQSLSNMLSQLGVTIPPGTNMQLRNVAAVMVTADLPPFSRPGQRVDIVVSSIANARSLRGGTLLMTPLKGADGD